MSDERHPGERWKAATLAPVGGEDGAGKRARLRLAAMAGHMKQDAVAARRAALVDLLADGRPHRREAIWEAIGAQLGEDCWGARADEALWRDVQVLREGGLRIAYSRRPGVEGYYLQHPPLERPRRGMARAHAQQAPGAAHLAAIREMSVAQKNRQAFSAAAFALRQKRLLLARAHPDRTEEQVDGEARRLVYGRHEIP